MALILSRGGLARGCSLLPVLGSCVSTIEPASSRIHRRGVPSTIQQVATLKATYGEKYPYPKPFPYEQRSYDQLAIFFDKTEKRFNENTKVIAIEGNIAVGKKDFARRLARMFDLKLYTPTSDARCYLYKPYGYDMRRLDPILPESARSYDLARFLSDPHPERGHAGKLQLEWYKQRLFDYCDSMEHLVSTGQGFVVSRSVFSDEVFVEALKRMGWITKNFFKYYWDPIRDHSICELHKPHLTIYLDAPVDVIRKRINKRNDPREVNSKLLTDDYLKAIEDSYREIYLPKMRKYGEVVEVDWTEVGDDNDIEVIAEEIQLIKLEPADNEDKKFPDWQRLSIDDWIRIREFYTTRRHQDNLFSRPEPWDCPEVMPTESDRLIMRRIYDTHPLFKFTPGWAPHFGHGEGYLRL